MVEVTLLPGAEEDYEAALAWYFERSEQAAAGFEGLMERALEFVARFPEACPPQDERHRYCALRRYPYGLVYLIDGEQVRVVAVSHDRQLPGYWLDREG